MVRSCFAIHLFICGWYIHQSLSDLRKSLNNSFIPINPQQPYITYLFLCSTMILITFSHPENTCDNYIFYRTFSSSITFLIKVFKIYVRTFFSKTRFVYILFYICISYWYVYYMYRGLMVIRVFTRETIFPSKFSDFNVYISILQTGEQILACLYLSKCITEKTT